MWSILNMKMIYKKGDKSNPENFRGIVLANCLLKVFTQILLNCLMIWDEDAKILPECQAGFRNERGCG